MDFRYMRNRICNIEICKYINNAVISKYKENSLTLSLSSWLTLADAEKI